MEHGTHFVQTNTIFTFSENWNGFVESVAFLAMCFLSVHNTILITVFTRCNYMGENVAMWKTIINSQSIPSSNTTMNGGWTQTSKFESIYILFNDWFGFRSHEYLFCFFFVGKFLDQLLKLRHNDINVLYLLVFSQSFIACPNRIFLFNFHKLF